MIQKLTQQQYDEKWSLIKDIYKKFHPDSYIYLKITPSIYLFPNVWVQCEQNTLYGKKYLNNQLAHDFYLNEFLGDSIITLCTKLYDQQKLICDVKTELIQQRPIYIQKIRAIQSEINDMKAITCKITRCQITRDLCDQLLSKYRLSEENIMKIKDTVKRLEHLCYHNDITTHLDSTIFYLAILLTTNYNSSKLASGIRISIAKLVKKLKFDNIKEFKTMYVDKYHIQCFDLVSGVKLYWDTPELFLSDCISDYESPLELTNQLSELTNRRYYYT